MTLARTIFAALIAISVTMLPVAGAAAFKLKSADVMHMADMSAAEPMDDCCPPDANPCKGMDDCLSMAGCSLTSFSLSGVSATTIVFPPLLAGIMPRPAGESLDSHLGSPPFRPPRI